MNNIIYKIVYFAPNEGERLILSGEDFALIESTFNDQLAELDLGDKVTLYKDGEDVEQILSAIMTIDGIQLQIPSPQVPQQPRQIAHIGTIGVGSYIRLLDHLNAPVVVIDELPTERRQIPPQMGNLPLVMDFDRTLFSSDNTSRIGKSKGGNNKSKDPKKRKANKLYRGLTNPKK